MNNKRQMCIERIVKTLRVMKAEKLDYDRKKFLQEIMSEFLICEKTAVEYLDMGIKIFERKPDEKSIFDEVRNALCLTETTTRE